MSSQQQEVPPLSKSHQEMTESYDEHVKCRAKLDFSIAESIQSIGMAIGLVENMSNNSYPSKSADIVTDCRNRDEIVLLQCQVSKLEEMSRAKEAKLARLERELLDAQQLQQQKSKHSKNDPANIRQKFNDVLSIEESIRELEHSILHANKILADMIQEFRAKSDTAELLSQKLKVLDAKLEVLHQETNSTKVSISRVDQKMRDLLHRGRASQSQLDEENESIAIRDALLADIETAEKELQELLEQRDVANSSNLAAGRGQASPSPGRKQSPYSKEDGEKQPLRRVSSYRFSSPVRTFQKITETLALMKAFLFNLHDDLDFITQTVGAISSDPEHDDNEWRQDKLSDCFLDCVLLMQKPYAEDVESARELLNAMKCLVVVWDLFESSLEDDIETVLERQSIKEESLQLFQAAQVCTEVIEEERIRRIQQRKQSNMGRRKSGKHLK